VANVATGSSHTVVDLAETIGRLLGRPVAQVSRPSRAGDVEHSLADISLATGLFGYRPRLGFEEGLALSIDHLTRKEH
jgi:nucleoside-diphosphate-sugar epimerase